MENNGRRLEVGKHIMSGAIPGLCLGIALQSFVNLGLEPTIATVLGVFGGLIVMAPNFITHESLAKRLLNTAITASAYATSLGAAGDVVKEIILK